MAEPYRDTEKSAKNGLNSLVQSRRQRLMPSTFLNIARLEANRLAGFLLLIIVVWLCGLPTAQAAEQSVKLAGMDVTVWSQEMDKGIKQPVIIFSHGFHGCATQSRFLMEAFASAGYIIFAPNHRDATCQWR